MIAEFIKPEDKRWKKFTECVEHDFYHLPEYLRIAASHEGGVPRAFYFSQDSSQFLVPLLIKNVPEAFHAPADWRDASSPYGYPSPLVTDPDDASFLLKALNAFREIGAEQGIISAFLRLHPLLPLPLEGFDGSGTLIKHGNTVYINLSLSEEELWSQIRKDHRKGIRRLRKSNFYITKDDWGQYDDFIAMYQQNMKLIGAQEFYFFSNA